MPHEPKKKRSKSTKNTRRSVIKLTSVNLIICKNCNAKTISHMACRACGFYGGKSIRAAEQKVTITKA